ncbi:MAG: hypothetical protein ACYS15_08770 [Planctomycetota bacterium]
MKLSCVLIVAALAFAAGISAGQTSRPGSPVTLVDLPLKLPAVGNLGAVRQWRFGRLQSVEQIGGQGDLVLSIRTKDGTVLRMGAPGPALLELARDSEWIRFGRATPGRTEYVERMIAFDVDANQRLIAIISMEPVFRDRNRLRRALGNR